MASNFKKKTEVKLEVLTDINTLLMVQKGIRGGICDANHDKNKESTYLKYSDANIIYKLR